MRTAVVGDLCGTTEEAVFVCVFSCIFGDAFVFEGFEFRRATVAGRELGEFLSTAAKLVGDARKVRGRIRVGQAGRGDAFRFGFGAARGGGRGGGFGSHPFNISDHVGFD